MEYNVTIAKTEGKQLTVRWDELPPAAQSYIIGYGLKQALNDVHASITAKEVPDAEERAEQCFTASEQRLANLLQGIIPAAGAKRGESDPLLAVAMSYARERVMAAFKAAGKPWRGLGKDKRDAVVEAYYARYTQQCRAEAQKRLDAAGGDVFDLDALLG